MSEPIRLFISCHKDDVAWRERLETMLSPVAKGGNLRIWHEGLVPPGAITETTVAQELVSAQVAILLASAKFISTNDEQLEALVRRRQQGMEFLWVPIGSALYDRTALEGVPPVWKEPLALLGSPALEEKALEQIARDIDMALARLEDGAGAIDLSDKPNGVIRDSRPPEIKVPDAGAGDNATSDTDQLLVALIDRQYQEKPILDRSRITTGQTLLIVPGPRVHSPSLFIKRLKAHTFVGLQEELRKRNLALSPCYVGWPSFPSPTGGSKGEIDIRLKSIIAELQVKSQITADSLDTETPETYAARAFKTIRDKADAFHIFVLQLVNAVPSVGEHQCFTRFLELWEKFCAEHAPPNILIIFVASASSAEIDAGYGGGNFARFHHAKFVEEMRNVTYNDINIWLSDNRLSTCFKTDAIDELAYGLDNLRSEGVPMSQLAKVAESWLSQNRIRR